MNYNIPANVLAQVDIAALQEKMQEADWYYEYSDDRRVWDRGCAQIRDIKNELEKMCAIEGGKMAAQQLWDAYVPRHSIVKPEWLRDPQRPVISSAKKTNRIR